LIKPATSGTGLIAGSVVRTILEVGGVQNALSKSLGSSNKINMAYATLEALGISLPKDKWLNSRDKSQETRVKNDEKAVKKEATKKETPFAAKAKEGNK
jgi:small subunit ribosomal protein S5